MKCLKKYTCSSLIDLTIQICKNKNEKILNNSLTCKILGVLFYVSNFSTELRMEALAQ